MEYENFSGKSVEAAVEEAAKKFNTTTDQLDIEVVDEGSAGFFGLRSKPAVIKAKKKFTLEGSAEEFLKDVFRTMNLDVELDIEFDEEENTMNIDLKGDDMGILIGKRGQTLDSLQYLTSLVVNKHTEEYTRIKLDIENYRERRKETLETLAKNIAYKVKRSKRPVSLEPMNPYERRIIHSALQNDKYVLTRSEGEEPYRHVVIALKKEKREFSRDYNSRGGYRKDFGGSRGGYRGNYGRKNYGSGYGRTGSYSESNDYRAESED